MLQAALVSWCGNFGLRVSRLVVDEGELLQAALVSFALFLRFDLLQRKLAKQPPAKYSSGLRTLSQKYLICDDRELLQAALVSS